MKPRYTPSSHPLVAELQSLWIASKIPLPDIVTRIRQDPLHRVSRTTILAILQRGSPANLHSLTAVAEVLGRRIALAKISKKRT